MLAIKAVSGYFLLNSKSNAKLKFIISGIDASSEILYISL
jgi:hypothetical protein